MTPREVVEQLIEMNGWEHRIMESVPFDAAYVGIDVPVGVGFVRLLARGQNLDECFRQMAEFLRSVALIGPHPHVQGESNE